KLLGVKEEPVEPVALAEEPVVLALAVPHVADERAGDVLQVPPDLVEPPRPGQRGDEAVAAEHLEPLDLGHGGHALAAALSSEHGVVDDEPLGGDAADEREVA